jgi:Zn-dependent M28 family amino/carboxypeptidase
MGHVRALTTPEMAGREAGQAGERRAADYIVKQLEAAAALPAGKYRHRFPFRGAESLNVVATIEGHGARKSEHVILGAHMDHLGTRDGDVFHGAEDNASGVAVVLEIAFALASNSEALDRSVTLAFFGAEEQGLVGSRAFAAKPPVSPMVAMVNIDMIGRDLIDQAGVGAVKPLFGLDDRRAIGVLGTKGRPVFATIVEDAASAEGMKAWAPEDLPGPLTEWAERESKGRGDSFSFEAVGVPALFFGQGESDDYHKPTDTPDKLVPHAMAARARVIQRVVIALSHADLSKTH